MTSQSHSLSIIGNTQTDNRERRCAVIDARWRMSEVAVNNVEISRHDIRQNSSTLVGERRGWRQLPEQVRCLGIRTHYFGFIFKQRYPVCSGIFCYTLVLLRYTHDYPFHVLYLWRRDDLSSQPRCRPHRVRVIQLFGRIAEGAGNRQTVRII